MRVLANKERTKVHIIIERPGETVVVSGVTLGIALEVSDNMYMEPHNAEDIDRVEVASRQRRTKVPQD